MVAVHDFLLIESPGHQVLGSVIDIHMVDERINRPTRPTRPPLSRSSRTTWAKVSLLSFSDGQQRPPDGTAVRRPRSLEVTTLLAEARVIPEDQRVPMGVIPLRDGMAPVYAHLQRLVGPTATSALLTGAAGSLKSTAGVLMLTGIQQRAPEGAAIVLVNSKGNDFLFADYPRQYWSGKLDLPALSKRDLAIYAALGYPDPPVLQKLIALVPQTNEDGWKSARPLDFPRTIPFSLSFDSAIRYACAPSDDDERASSIITRQCIEEAAGPFAQECGITTLGELVQTLEDELLSLSSERARWRHQFQGGTVAAALRQLRATLRDLGPILGNVGTKVRFPVEQLAQGGTWVVDIAPLPHRAAQAVLDDLITALWNAKAEAVIPHNLPLVLLVDELNRWSATGPTASRLAAIVRDQRHRRFSLVGLAQQLSTLHPQLLANADTFWIGSTHSREAMEDVYNHLPQHLREQLHRLPQGRRLLDAWPFAQPLSVEVPFPSWLISDEGLAVVEAWRSRRQNESPERGEAHAK